MVSPLLEDIVRKTESFRSKLPTGQISEKFGDYVRFRIVVLVQDDVKELFEFDHTRVILVIHGYEMINIFSRLDKPQANERTIKLLGTDRLIAINVQGTKELFQKCDLIISEVN